MISQGDVTSFHQHIIIFTQLFTCGSNLLKKFSIIFCMAVNRFQLSYASFSNVYWYAMHVFRKFILLHYMRMQQPHLKMFVAYAFDSNV